MHYIKGIYKKAIFSNENGFVIGIMKVEDTDDSEMYLYLNKTITFTGTFANLIENDRYILHGKTVIHPKYGFQFNVDSYERVKPEDRESIIAFLSSDLFKTIGVSLATSIVDKLGVNALDKILEEPSVLDDVPKLSHKKAKIIIETLNKYEESHKTIVYLNEIGFNLNDALLIYNKFKGDTISKIESNIYSVLDTDLPISFLTIDRISQNMTDEISIDRIKACIVYSMEYLTNTSGDTYLFYDEIKKMVENYLNIKIEDIDFNNYIDELRYENKIIKEDDKYFIKEIFDCENNVANKLKYLVNNKSNNLELEPYLEQLELEGNVKYNDVQKKAILSSLTNNVTIITGGPGTGKTTIIKAIVDLYIAANKLSTEEAIKRIALLAPTGRASKRMSEATNFNASTIHRFLKWNKETNSFMVNEFNKDLSELIIIDEMSMIDIVLLNKLLEGLTMNIKLVFVGDYNQLPSVGAGQVLKDLIDSDVINKIELKYLYRQSEESFIPTFASLIKDNELTDDNLMDKSDFTFLKCNKDLIVKNLKQICNLMIEKNYDYKKVQIMAPMYAGVNGIDNINKELQGIFNPKTEFKREIKVGDVIYRENDKILQLSNMPDENVYNGDVGTIKYIKESSVSKSHKNEIYVDFDGNIVRYLPSDFNKIKHGYIISIHKSQGSEFDTVILLLSTSYFRMLYKKLLYTGITRAKRKLILLGEPNALKYAITNDNEKMRKTSLKDKLISID